MGGADRLAPIGVQAIVHPDGELAVARAAAEVGVPLIIATPRRRTPWRRSPPPAAMRRAGFSCTCPMSERSRRAFSHARKPPVTRRSSSRLTRGCSAGARATSSTRTCRSSEERESRTTSPTPGSGPALNAHPRIRRRHQTLPRRLLRSVGELGGPRVPSRTHDAADPLEGIQHPDDARRAQAAGMDGIVVSNHGGRQVDGAVASLDALAHIVDIDPGIEILFDSGSAVGPMSQRRLPSARARSSSADRTSGRCVAGADGVAELLRTYSLNSTSRSASADTRRSTSSDAGRSRPDPWKPRSDAPSRAIETGSSRPWSPRSPEIPHGRSSSAMTMSDSLQSSRAHSSTRASDRERSG